MSSPLIDEVKARTAELNAQVARMQKATHRSMLFLSIVGGVLVLYMAWAFHRIATFIEPARLADVTGEIALGQVHEAIDNGTRTLHAMAPEMVRDAETAIIREVPAARAQLQARLEADLRGGLKAALAPGDRVMVQELRMLPDGKMAVHSILENPEKASPFVFAQIRARVDKRPDVVSAVNDTRQELTRVRDQLRKLQNNVGLTPSERAERRFLQIVVASVGVPGPVDAAKADEGQGKTGLTKPVVHPKKAHG